MALSDMDKSLNSRPSVTPEQKKRWKDEAVAYANTGGGGIKQFLTDYARNAGQLGGGAIDVAGGVISAPFAAAADGITNGTKALLGAENTNPSRYRQQSYNAVNGGLNNIMDVTGRTGAGVRDLLGWQKANSNAGQTIRQSPQVSNNIETVAMTPQQQANYNYYNVGSQPTGVNGVRKLLTNNTPLFTNVKPQFDKEGNEISSPQMINSIPSFMPNQKGMKPQVPNIPFYNQGTQANIIEDSTKGGYYQRRKADNKNKKTIELLNNANKETWGLNRQNILDNSQLQNNTEASRVLSTQAETAERINNLDKMLADFRLPQQQRLAALQTRSLLSQGVQQPQKNAVNVVTEEMNDGSKKQRIVVTDPSTGETIGGNTQQVNRSDIAKLAQASGKTEQQVVEELRGLGFDII